MALSVYVAGGGVSVTGFAKYVELDHWIGMDAGDTRRPVLEAAGLTSAVAVTRNGLRNGNGDQWRARANGKSKAV